MCGRLSGCASVRLRLESSGGIVVGISFVLDSRLPTRGGLLSEVFVSTRRMPQDLRQGLDVARLRGEATFEISLKHHADVERRPRRSPLSHLFLEHIHVVTGVANVLAQQPAPNRC